MFLTSRMALALLLVSVVLVAAAADSKFNELAAPPSPHIDYGALGRDGVQCSKGNEANCSPQRNGNPYNRGCNAIDRCRCCRRMLLEDQLPVVAHDFGTLKHYLINKFFN